MRTDVDAVVIGAGAAGLMAARDLARRSLRVVLLEARERAGGRIWSHPIRRSATRAELGAEFIHGPAPQTRALLRAAGTAVVPMSGYDFVTVARIFERARRLPGDESVDDFLRRFAGDESMRETVVDAREFVEGFDAADPATASVQSIAEEWHSGVDATSARPRGGYGPMVERLRDEAVAAGAELLTSTIVRRITWSRGEVAVESLGPNGSPTAIRARAGVVTLPAGVLRHAGDASEVAFDPELPPAKREALRFIEMGHVVKIVLWYRTAFWERTNGGRYRDTTFFRSRDKAFPAYWTQYPVRSTLVVAWAGGPRAIALDRFTRAKLIERARKGFAAIVGEPERAQKEFEGAAMHDWTHDPFARGAYSYVTVGGGGTARAALGAPVDDTLFFAGEAMAVNGQGGTVNGALESGERAAAEAAHSLGAG